MPSRNLERDDQNESKVQEKIHLSQGRARDGAYPATYPQGKERRKPGVPRRRPLGPLRSNPKQRRTSSEGNNCDTSSTLNCSIVSSSQPPEFVDRFSLPLHPIKPESVLNGSANKESIQRVQDPQKMSSFRIQIYEPTGMADQETSAAIGKPPPKDDEASNTPREPVAGTPPGTSTFESLSKNDRVQFYTLHQKIRRLREHTWGLRSRVQEQRGILRSKQYDKAAADDKYIQLARLKESQSDQERHSITSEGRTLQELFRECERVRAEYGPIEDDCNALEDELGSKEYELTKLEENFVKICKRAIPHDSQAPSPISIPESRSEGSDSNLYQTYHPWVTEYLFKMGDVDNWSERLDRHLEEKAELEEARETRQNVNYTLAPEDEEWLQESEELEQIIRKELRAAEKEAEELKRKCIEADLLDEDGEPKDFQTQEQEAFVEDVDAKGQKSEYLKFPNLLLKQGTRDLKFKASAPRPGEQSEGAGDHINQWLLHNLRTSPLDVGLLARTFEADFGRIEGQKWESDVRDHWYKDGTIKDASGYRVYSAASTTQIRAKSKVSLQSSSGHKYEPVLGITSRKKVLSDTSSVSGSEIFGMDEENEMIVGPLPRSKYSGNGS